LHHIYRRTVLLSVYIPSEIKAVERIRRGAEAIIKDNLPELNESPRPMSIDKGAEKLPVKSTSSKTATKPEHQKKPSIREQLAKTKVESVTYSTEKIVAKQQKEPRDMER